MSLIENLFLLMGAIALFLYGLNTLSSGVKGIAGIKMKSFVKSATSTRCGGVLAGTLCTAVAQSSIATNMIVITFVESGVMGFLSACAVIMGTNIGTTVTAQLVSISSVSQFEFSAIGSLIAFIGFIFTLFKRQNLPSLGSAMLGFGFIFMGIELLTDVVECFKGYSFFTGLFLVKNPFLLVLNGFFITAVLQSSSVVTSIMTVLASIGVLQFESATFIILGANIGTCLPVIFAALSMGKESVKTAFFNIAFNIFGGIVFFLPLLFFGNEISALAIFCGEPGRAIANFHTLFNMAVCLILLPILKPFSSFCEKLTEKLFLSDKRSKIKQNKKQLFLKRVKQN